METKKEYVLIKVEKCDFNETIYVLGVSDDREAAVQAWNDAVFCEKDNQSKFGIMYDTVDESEGEYQAFNEGYEATDSIRIFIAESHKIEKFK